MIFHGELIKLYKSDGETLCGYGVEWTEARPLQEKLLWVVAVAFLIVGGFTALMAVAAMATPGSPFRIPLAVMAASSFGLFWMIGRAAARLPGTPKVIEFHEDGRIWDSKDGEWKMRSDNIRSIEALEVKPKRKPEDSDYTHGVRLITRRGRIFRIAQNLEPDDSVTLAVLLNEAIEGTRYVPAVTTSAQSPGMVW
ncbi:MAG: hypothetical protein JNL45_18040 [Hyphomicrobium sp.]|nr:hypothetical protein [Hyphomicrobium sp.]